MCYVLPRNHTIPPGRQIVNGFVCPNERQLDMRHIPATLRHAQARILEQTHLSPTQRVTLAAVVARLAADGTGACFASLATLEVDTGINERTIRRNLEALASTDIIEPACRGWKLTEDYRAELFPKSVLCTTPDILPSVVDKKSDRREGFDLSPSERISPDGGNSEKPGWIPVSIGAWRKLAKLAREAGHKLIVVAEYAKQYIANLDAKRAYGYLLKLIGQDKDYAWMAGDAYKSGGKAGAR